MYPNLTRPLLIAIATFALTACATRKEKVLPHGEATMFDIWNQSATGVEPGSGATRQLLDARKTLRRPLTDVSREDGQQNNEAYTRTAVTEIDSLFRRLPNPDLVMYVFPHLSGSDPVPVPGYSTVFPLYQRVQYAMPGERTDDY